MQQPQLTGQTMRIMFEQSPIAMCSVLSDGTILRANPAFARLTRATTDSLVEPFHGTERAQLAELVRAVAAGEQRSFKLEARLGAGGRRWCEINGIAMGAGGSGDVMIHMVEVSEARQREIDLREHAERDPLTGLHNTSSFTELLAQRLAQDARGTLLLLGLDRFKAVNERYGRERGDDVLSAIARAIADSVRASDVVARMGGDQFAILLNVDIPASPVAASLIRRISVAATIAARMPEITASVGIAALRSGACAEEMLADVDRAMHAAKRRGRGRSVFIDMLSPAEPRRSETGAG